MMFRPTQFLIGLVCATVLGLTGPVVAAPVTLSGELSATGDLSIAQLQALGSTAEAVGADTYVGVPLWNVLGGTSAGASNIITTGGGNNAILRSFVMATGSGGQRSLISVGEINPLFGGVGQPTLVAYQKNGVVLDTPQLILPQDSTGTRSVTALTSLSVGSATRPPVGAGGVTSQFSLTGPNVATAFTLASLQGLPATTATNVTFLSGGVPSAPNDFTGVQVLSLLTAAGLELDDILTSYLTVVGSDGYEVLFSLAELDPELGGRLALIAYDDTAGSLESPTGSGFARIVIPGDIRGGRFVSNIQSISVVDVVEPTSLALFGSMLAGGIALARRRKDQQISR